MNAVELIDQIESLPLSERNKVIDFVRHLEQKQFEDEQIKIAIERDREMDEDPSQCVLHEDAMMQVRAALNASHIQ